MDTIETHPLATSIAAIPLDGSLATLHRPGATYPVEVFARRFKSVPGTVELSRPGHADKLYVSVSTARKRMTPVRLNGATEADRTVATVVLPVGETPHISWGMSWALGAALTDPHEDEVDALIALASVYLV